MNNNPSLVKDRSVLAITRDLIWTLRLVWQTHSGRTLALACLTILQGFLPIAQLWIWKLFIDTTAVVLQTNAPVKNLFWHLTSFMGIQAILYILGSFLNTAQGTMQQILGELLQNRINLMILEKANSLELSFFENAQFYDRLQNARVEAGYRPLQMTVEIFSLCQSIITLSSMAIMLIRLHYAILIIIVITLFPILWVQSHYGNANYWMIRERAPGLRKQQYISSVLTTDWVIKEIRTYQLENYLFNMYKLQFSKFFRDTRSLLIKQNLSELLASFFSMLGWLSAIGYVIYRITLRSISIGDITLYTQAISQTQSQFYSVMNILGSLYKDILFTHNLYSFLQQPARDLSAGRTWNEDIDKIEFRDVSFRYPGSNQFVLKNINFEVERGQVMALIGKNGTGKTSLIKLLSRLYEPTSGQILVNGKNISEYSPHSVQKYIAAVFQDYGHYHLTARENIGIGQVEQINNLNAIKESARLSGADPIIQALPNTTTRLHITTRFRLLQRDFKIYTHWRLLNREGGRHGSQKQHYQIPRLAPGTSQRAQAFG